MFDCDRFRKMRFYGYCGDSGHFAGRSLNQTDAKGMPADLDRTAPDGFFAFLRLDSPISLYTTANNPHPQC